MYCRVCDIEYPKTLRYCKWCGGALADKEAIGSQHCPACGTSVNREWLFCNECGVDLASISAQPRDQTCPSCSAAVRKGWMFCRQCGEQIVTGRAEGRCDVCGGGMRKGWQFCKQCGAPSAGRGAAMGGAPSDSARFATVTGIPAVGVQADDEPFSGLGSGELPSVDAMIDRDRKKQPAASKGRGQGQPAAETHNITFGKVTGPMGSKDLPGIQPGTGESASEEDSLRTVAMEIAPDLKRKPQKPPESKAPDAGFQVPAGFSNQPTVAIPAVPEPPAERPAGKAGYQVPQAFSNQPTVAIPAVPEPPEPAPQDVTPGKAGYQVPSAFSNHPTVAIPAVPEPPEERPAGKAGYQVPTAFSNQPTVAIPAVPDHDDGKVGVQPPAGFSPMPTVAIPATLDQGDDAVAGHAAPAGFSGSPTLAFPSVPGEEVIDPYSTFDPSVQPPSPADSQGLATTVMAAPQFSTPSETAIISPPLTDSMSAVPTSPNMPGYESSPPAYAGTASVPAAEIATSQVQKPVPATAASGGSSLKWVAVAVVGVAILAVVAAVGLFLWGPWRSPAPEPVAQPTAPVTAPVTAPPTAPAPQAPVVPDGMVAVAGGTVQIGSDAPDADEYSKPAHTVNVKPFFVDTNEVTNAQYKEFVEKTGHPAPTDWAGGTYPAGADQLPVVNVTWSDAAAYAKWAGKRLPTEVEWEVAARGTDGRLYPWGNAWNPSAVNADQKTGTPKPVGSYTAGASPCGANDMIGNVWEWTATDYEPYPNSSATWPKDETGKERRPIKIIRGGAYNSGSKVNATWRGFQEPDKIGPRLGFRCVKDAS